MSFLGGFDTVSGPVLGAIVEPLQQWLTLQFTASSLSLISEAVCSGGHPAAAPRHHPDGERAAEQTAGEPSLRGAPREQPVVTAGEAS